MEMNKLNPIMLTTARSNALKNAYFNFYKVHLITMNIDLNPKAMFATVCKNFTE